MNAEDTLSPILVADDNPTDVFFLQRRLALAGIHNPLEHVEDGLEAIRWLEQRLHATNPGELRPWLVFLDLKMPRKDGFEVLSWLHAQQLGGSLTVAVLSTSDEPVDMERATRLGAQRFLVKYPRPTDLIEVVALARRRALSGAALHATGPGESMGEQA